MREDTSQSESDFVEDKTRSKFKVRIIKKPTDLLQTNDDEFSPTFAPPWIWQKISELK